MTIQCGECNASCSDGENACKSCGCPLPKRSFKTLDDSSSSQVNGTPSLVLGLLSIVLWILPIIGLPLSIVAWILSAKAYSKSNGKTGNVARVLAIIGCLLSIINGVIGCLIMMGK